MKISVKPSPSWPKRLPPTEVERLRIRIDKLVAQLDDVPPALLAKLLMAKSLDVLLEAEGSLATISTVGRAADLLGGRWGPESIKVFLETKNY
jgi:hypothetical protein